MCTAITYQTKDHYFGRNLDLEYSYHETVTVTPRNYPFRFRKVQTLEHHYAMIGMAYVVEDYPLYYDAVNEKGLAMAGLNFPKNAVYCPEAPGRDNVTPFEFIPWILGQCATVAEAENLLEYINLVNINFSDQLPLSPLHWIIADKEEAITVEAVTDGLKIYDNPFGVLTNNPPFDFMMNYLTIYRDLSANSSENNISDRISLPVYCQGLGGMGLPGDYSSPSRFVRAAFTKLNAVCGDSEGESVSQFFHLLGAVEMPRGCVRLENDKNELTIYSCCSNQDKGIYYYITYDNRRINAVDMHRENLEGQKVISYSLIKNQPIHFQN